MNELGVFVLCACGSQLAINLVSETLNIRALSPIIPKAFRDVYDAADYRKSQEYTRAKAVVSQAKEVYDLALFLVLWWFGGGFDWLDQQLRARLGDGVVQGVAFLLSYALGELVLTQPFALYSTFVLEERFGFNKTTARTYVLDLLKSIALLVVLGGLVCGAVLWFFETAGASAWLYCWGFLAAFTVVMQFLSPIFILPLFYDFTPLPDGELKAGIDALAKKVGFSFSGIFEVDGSRRSSHSNAFFTGIGRAKRIALFDTLVKSHSTQEVVAVLAHEIGHNKKHHIIITSVLSILNTGLVLYLCSFLMHSPALFQAFFITTPSTHLGLVLATAVYSPLSFFTGIGMTMLSRHNEFEADRYSVENYGNGGRELVSGLKKLSKENATNLTPHWLYVFLNYSHPPMLQRIEAIEGWARKAR